MAKQYRLDPIRKLVNRIMTFMVRRGRGPKGTHLLSTRGRRTGQTRTTPVTLVEDGGTRWLVAPYGPVGWVHNIRAEGTASLRRGEVDEQITVTEVGPAEAAPVLKRYLSDLAIVRPFFDVSPDSDLAAFEAEAPRHPVFRIA